jgi:hypothetical protein
MGFVDKIYLCFVPRKWKQFVEASRQYEYRDQDGKLSDEKAYQKAYQVSYDVYPSHWECFHDNGAVQTIKGKGKGLEIFLHTTYFCSQCNKEVKRVPRRKVSKRSSQTITKTYKGFKDGITVTGTLWDKKCLNSIDILDSLDAYDDVKFNTYPIERTTEDAPYVITFKSTSCFDYKTLDIDPQELQEFQDQFKKLGIEGRLQIVWGGW